MNGTDLMIISIIMIGAFALKSFSNSVLETFKNIREQIVDSEVDIKTNSMITKLLAERIEELEKRLK